MDVFARGMLCDVCVDMVTGNKIGVRGVSALCDALKDNTTLTALDIGGEVPWWCVCACLSNWQVMWWLCTTHREWDW